jgi:hypothetical protein
LTWAQSKADKQLAMEAFAVIYNTVLALLDYELSVAIAAHSLHCITARPHNHYHPTERERVEVDPTKLEILRPIGPRCFRSSGVSGI